MAAAVLNFNIEQGSTFFRKLTFKDTAMPTPNLINLTGNSYAGKLRKTATSETVVAIITCTVLDQGTNEGEMTIEMSPTVTAAIPIRCQAKNPRTTQDFAYDIEVTYPSGKVERILQGVFNVSPEATR
jgi:hypothetical protein